MNGFIYRITCRATKKYYIGQTIQDPYRYFKETYIYCKGKGRIKIFNAINKYGIDSFKFDVIDSASNKEQLDQLEDYYISFWDTINKGLNCKTGGANGKHSQETKDKISKALSGKKHSQESLNKMSLSQKGRIVTQATRKKLSDINIGKKHSQESRNKMSLMATGKKLGMLNPNSIEVTIRHIITNQVAKGSLSQLAREYGFSRDCMRKYNKSNNWELVTSIITKEN